MGFQLANDEGEGIISPNSSNNTEQTTTTPVSPDSDFPDDGFQPEDNDTPYIADRYQNTKPSEPVSSGSATILTQNNTFSPILTYIGAVFYTFSFIYALITLNSGNLSIFDLGGIISMRMTMSVLVGIGSICWIVDAIIMASKNCAGWSLVLWAWIFPIVYLIKRFKANGDSIIIPVSIIAIEIILALFVGRSTNKLSEQAYADVGQNMLSMYTIAINGKAYTYSQLVDSNIADPVYEYKSATASDPEYLCVTGNTTLYGAPQSIEIRWNYASLNIMSITIGENTYTSSEDMYQILSLMAKKAPPVE